MFVQMWLSSQQDVAHKITENIASQPSFALSDPVTSEVLMNENMLVTCRTTLS